jgi:REP element-mobilizing transposase RayT
MARLSRIVVPDTPHHVTQRGNRRQALFTEAANTRFTAIFWPSAASITTSSAGLIA